jgi:hypothetical protein
MSEDVVVDYGATRRIGDWRSRVWWPISTPEANRIANAQVRRVLHWAAALPNEGLRDAVLLALPNTLGYARAIVLAAIATERARAAKRRFIGDAPEFAHLANGGEQPSLRVDPILRPVPMRFGFARRLVRIRTWTRGPKLLKALFRPDAIAISHNPLLRTVAAHEQRAIGFHHGQIILDDARRNYHGGAPSTGELAEPLAEQIIGDAPVAPPFRTRAGELIKGLVRAHLDTAARDMHALRRVPLAAEIWSASGGLYPSRAIGLEVLRRDGCVVRFGHGAPMSFLEVREIEGLLEMAVSSAVVLPTENTAQMWREYTDPSLYPWRSNVEVRGSNGDPVFARVPARRPPRTDGVLRVVYAPTLLLGFRQLMPCQPPDVVYLDWQLRVAEALRSLPVELVCQPHPEGLLQRMPHPLEGIATTVRGNFSAQLRHADVFVFDYAPTTALWEAACTDARIVFLDLGSGRMTPKIAELFAKRARVIDVPYDEGNRPVLDRAALTDAVLADHGAVDPTPLRRLLAGAQ